MTVLLDENIPIDFIRIVKNAGYEVKHVIYECRGKKDKDVFEYAVKHKMCIVSFDLDFCAFKQQKHYGIIKLSAKLDMAEEALLELLSKIKDRDIRDTYFQIDKKAYKETKIYGKRHPWRFKQYHKEPIILDCLCK